jgi:hypothetical protein
MSSAKTYNNTGRAKKRSPEERPKKKLYDSNGVIQLDDVSPKDIELNLRVNELIAEIESLEEAQLITNEILQLEFTSCS